MKNIVILISGFGSNMRSIVQHMVREQWQQKNKAQVCAVVSNCAGAKGLEYAQQQGIATHVIDHQLYTSRLAYDQALMGCIDQYAPNLVVLAGFMRILTPQFVCHYPYRILNIHPALLPSFKGLNTHQKALATGVKFHGATVHGVTENLDAGPIFLQSCVGVRRNDTNDSLAARVLQTEHKIYPQVISWWVHDQIVWNDSECFVRNIEPDDQFYYWDGI